MSLKRISDRQLVLEMVSRKLLSSAQGIRLLNKRSDDENRQREADEWIENNPEMYKAFKDKAVALARQGKRFSMRLLSEEIRWFFKTKGQPGKTYKIKDGLTPYIGVRVCQAHPEVRKFIQTRKRI